MQHQPCRNVKRPNHYVLPPGGFARAGRARKKTLPCPIWGQTLFAFAPLRQHLTLPYPSGKSIVAPLLACVIKLYSSPLSRLLNIWSIVIIPLFLAEHYARSAWRCCRVKRSHEISVLDQPVSSAFVDTVAVVKQHWFARFGPRDCNDTK